MNSSIWLLIPLWLFSFPKVNEPFYYGTTSPEARAAYLKGWEQILDRGEWTLAEASFRKAVDLDSDFLLAWSQVGRISKNPEERALIFQQLSDKKSQATDWEKKLLEVYLNSLKLIDAKDRELPITREQISGFYTLSESHFSDFLKVHPSEEPIYSEFIEVIHGIYGPKAALDSLQKQKSIGKNLNPFLISYSAQVQAELKDFENAFQNARELEKILDNSNLPIIPFTYAVIHFEKKEFEAAGKLLNQTLSWDGNHTLALRLKKQVDEKIKAIEGLEL
jgi:tetratricopeptide (TPR) repeat protein